MFNEYSDDMKKVPGRFIPYLIWIEAILINFLRRLQNLKYFAFRPIYMKC